MGLPMYFCGPPVAMQTNWVRCNLSLATLSGVAAHSLSVPLRVKLTLGSPAARLTKSSITAVIAGSPPRRSYSERVAIPDLAMSPDLLVSGDLWSLQPAASKKQERVRAREARQNFMTA